MAAPTHTYGPTCALHESDCDDNFAQHQHSSEPPTAKAQFFYISALPIDDPLSPLPPVTESKSPQSKAPPQPFSPRDNAALAEAWQGIQNHEKAQPATAKQPTKRFGEIFRFPKLRADDTNVANDEAFSENLLYDSDDADTGLAESLKAASLKAIPSAKRREEEKAAKKEAIAQQRIRRKTFKGEALHNLRQEAEAATEQSREAAADSVKELGDEPSQSKNIGRGNSDDVTLPKDGYRPVEKVTPPLAASKEFPFPDNIPKDANQPIGSSRPQLETQPTTTTIGSLGRDDENKNETKSSGALRPQALQSKKSYSLFGKLSRSSSKPRSRQEPGEETHVLLCDDPDHQEDAGDFLDQRQLNINTALSGLEPPKKSSNPFRSRSREVKRKGQHDTAPEAIFEQKTRFQVDGSAEFSRSAGMYTSGHPFARAPSHRGDPFADAFDGANDDSDAAGSEERDLVREGRLQGVSKQLHENAERSKSRGRGTKQSQNSSETAVVPVGIARLHLVELPALLMKPIYWSPLNDIAHVMRATWFYKDTMSPVEPDVANRIELGYEDMKPWTPTWQDELSSCIEIGAEAELKITRRLWPEDLSGKSSRPDTSAEIKGIDNQTSKEMETIELPKNAMNVAAAPASKKKLDRLFPNHSVIYVDDTNAQLLRPSLIPSPSKGRKPLSSIRKGRRIGIAVVRGFDRKAWDTVHPSKKMDAKTANAKIGAYMSQSGDAATQGRRLSCTACKMEERRPSVTDLVLVIHGIGQKLSERIDSYHFTHAINGFRRQVNVELTSEPVLETIREDMGGVMVLPVNWRMGVDFEDGGPGSASGKKSQRVENNFTLKDITPATLPAVRSLVSDVMLDIPYYMSHHREKMVSAVIKEANRVYRLWCRNNPGFHENGRVHVIAHSLGAAMSMDILSQQPTKLPKSIDLKSKVNEKIFEFDTKSLFCCGSPAGFFLLLNKSNLLPRHGRNKPGADGDDETSAIAGSTGTYGCLAVDNVYNIMHYNDPVAYHMNATVDVDYAESLKPASIPNASTGWFTSFANAFKWSTSSATPTTMITSASGPNAKARPSMKKLPTTIEMNAHDFGREDIAEKRMFLLNDNGQIDYFLSSGGGPLEIQYLNMLSAHSSYWTLRDFVRFVVMEVGRTPGRAGTLPVLRAEKKTVIKAGKIA